MRLSRTRHRRRELHRRLQTRPRLLAEYIRYGSDGSTLAFLPTTARTTDLWLPDASGVYQQYSNGEVGIIDGNAVWSQPSATNYTDGTDDLSGGPETVDLTSPGTGNYTLSVIGTAAVTVAAGTAVGTGFGQATEGSPVTFNLSSAGTVTLTLDSGTLETIGSSAAKQIEKNAFATSFIPTPAGTPVAINGTQPVVPWPSRLVNDFVICTTVNIKVLANNRRLFMITDGTADNRFDVLFSSTGRLQHVLEVNNTEIINNIMSTTGVVTTNSDIRLKALSSSVRGTRFFVDESMVLSNAASGILGVFDRLLIGHYVVATIEMLGTHKDIRIIKVDPNITDAKVLAL